MQGSDSSGRRSDEYVMLGRVYIFEREQALDAGLFIETLSSRVLEAVSQAMKARSEIRFEELTDPHNARPMVAMLFDRVADIVPFDRQLRALLAKEGVRVRVLRTSIGRPAIDKNPGASFCAA